MRRSLLCLIVLAAVVGAPVGSGIASAAARPAHQRAAPRTPDPVLLVHGFNGSGSGWQAMVAALVRAGWPPDSVDAMDYDSSLSNKEIARQVGAEVAALKARTGAKRVDVVTHSMGAISTRWYLERMGGAAEVGAWASLGGVNGGTIWAYACYVLAPCREMVPTSSVLDDLAHRFPLAGRTHFVAWWSPCDEVIVPVENARLPGARNVETGCIGHTAMRSDPTVVAQVVDFLRRPGQPVV